MLTHEAVKISKVTLTGGIFVKVSWEETLPGHASRNHPGMTDTRPVHENLLTAFSQLTRHMALICEEITDNDFIDSLPKEGDATDGYVPGEIELGEQVKAPIVIKEGVKGKFKKSDVLPNLLGELPEEVLAVDHFVCVAISIAGYGGTDSISLSGFKTLSTKKQMSLGTPMTKLEYDQYKHFDLLAQDWAALEYEVKELIVNGKCAPAVDPEFPFPKDDEQSAGTDPNESY